MRAEPHVVETTLWRAGDVMGSGDVLALGALACDDVVPIVYRTPNGDWPDGMPLGRAYVRNEGDAVVARLEIDPHKWKRVGNLPFRDFEQVMTIGWGLLRLRTQEPAIVEVSLQRRAPEPQRGYTIGMKP